MPVPGSPLPGPCDAARTSVSTPPADINGRIVTKSGLPMHNNNVADYLDAGSVRLFAQQISEAFDGVAGVAIHDTSGRLVWSGAGSAPGAAWLDVLPTADALTDSGHCTGIDDGGLVYTFPLERKAGGLAGTLSVCIAAGDAPPLSRAREELSPILACVERQIEINAELSAVRRLTTEGQQSMQLLVSLDELDHEAGPDSVLSALLARCAAHYDAELAAILAPDSRICTTHPPGFLETPNLAGNLMTTLSSLMSASKRTRQVFLSEIASGTGRRGGRRRVLCSPIVNSKDAIVGIFVLIREARFTRGQVRLSRAICTKINALLRSALHDANTRLSRHEFLAHAENVMQRHPNTPHALLYLDIDKLHVVNDRFGHMAGDQVIRAVARAVAEVAGNDDSVCHLGGDVFAMFLRNADATRASEKADVLLEAIAGMETTYGDRSVRVTASTGIALFPDVVGNASAALNTAEVAARSAKGRGGNRIVVFRDADASVAQRRSDLDQVNRLQSALIDDRFVLYAQPIEALNERESCARYEILVRLEDEAGVVVPPDKFLSAAERYQMMSALDRWVIRNTLELLGRSDNVLEISLGSFSINVSAQSLIDDGFIDFVEARIVESGIPPDSLCFEITETAVVRNLERAQRCVRRLRAMGCRLALDDFGTGYCSFAYLKDLPVQYIKIDGVFVRDMLENPLSEAIITSTTSIARVIGAATVAEHVENELVMQRLRMHNVDFMQGFAVGRPQPLTDIMDELGSGVVAALADTGIGRF